MIVETIDEVSAQEKTFTQEEVNKLIAEKVAIEKEKFAKEKEEREISIIQYEQDRLAERECELNRRELLTETKTLLTTEGFSVEIADLIIGTDIEETTANFNKFEQLFKQEVDKAVNARFKAQGRSVSTSLENTQTTINIAEIAKKHRKR